MPAKRERNHAARHIRQAIYNHPWSILPETLEVMVAILDAENLTSVEIQERLGFNSDAGSRMQVVNGTAIIPVTGIIRTKIDSIVRYYGGTSTEQLEQDFQKAVNASDVSRIVLLIDSPGGSAIGNEEVSQVIFANRGKKPITAYVRGIAASAAYYIASAADVIVASPSSSIGSIGSMLVHGDFSKAYEEFGIKPTVIAYGKHKADGNPYQPLTEQSHKTLQDYVTAYGKQFVEAVARHRGITSQEVLDKFGQGKVFLANEAKEIGLIDAVGDWGFALQQAGSQSVVQIAEAVLNHHAKHGQPAIVADFQIANGSWVRTISSIEHPPTEEANSEAVELNQESGTGPGQVVGQQNAASAAKKEESKTMKRIKAALYALGLVDSQDVSDEVAQAALRGFFRGDVPQDEAEVLKKLSQAFGGEQPTEATPNRQVEQVAESVNPDQVRTEAVAAERARQSEIRATGQLLGLSAEQIQAGIDSGKPHAEVYSAWRDELVNSEKPVRLVTPTESQDDKFVEGVTDALLLRCGYAPVGGQPSQHSRSLMGASLHYIASESLRMSGQRVPMHATPEEVALRALQMNPQTVVLSGSPAFNRPGDFPNLLSNLAGKILDQALQLAEPTYPMWTGRMSDLPDFKPKTLIGMGSFDELDLVMDDEDAKPLDLAEELSGWIQVDRFANAIGLTPVMIANDDLDGFSQGLVSLAVAHENTLNRLCVAILTSNPTLPDGVALFNDASHGNDITSGGVPSTTEAKYHRLKHRAQTGIGGKGKMRTPPKIALVPSSLEEAALQTFMTFGALSESKLPVTDATINVYRGQITPIVEPELEDNSSAIWYTLADPKIRRVVVHAFQRGYGAGGRRTTWFDEGRETRYVKLEGRFGAAAVGHRGIIRNAGSGRA